MLIIELTNGTKVRTKKLFARTELTFHFFNEDSKIDDWCYKEQVVIVKCE